MTYICGLCGRDFTTITIRPHMLHVHAVTVDALNSVLDLIVTKAPEAPSARMILQEIVNRGPCLSARLDDNYTFYSAAKRRLELDAGDK